MEHMQRILVFHPLFLYPNLGIGLVVLFFHNPFIFPVGIHETAQEVQGVPSNFYETYGSFYGIHEIITLPQLLSALTTPILAPLAVLKPMLIP